MGVSKWITRKGDVGQTARWVAQAFMSALTKQIIEPKNCETREGMQAELEKIVAHALDVRFSAEPNHPSREQITRLYEASILTEEVDLHDNPPHLITMYTEVIIEEMQNAGVGDAFIYGNPL